MLRRSNYFLSLLIAVLLFSGAAFSQRTGGEVAVTKCWQFPAENVIDVATNGHDIFTIDGGRILAVSSKGEKLWQTDLGGEVLPDLKLENGMAVVTTRSASGA